jgi:hypothetical protein
VPGVDLINRDQCRNGQPSLEVYMAQFTATQRSSTINGSITNGSFWPNGYLAVTVSSVWESTSASLYAASWLTWTRYSLLQAPPPTSEIRLCIQGRERPTDDVLQVAWTPAVLRWSRPLHTRVYFIPLGPVAYKPYRSPRPTAGPVSIATCLMALLPVDDLRGPIYSAPLRP